MDEEMQRYRVEQAHSYLERIRKLGEDCAALQAEADDARDRASGLTGIDYSRDMVSATPTDDAMADAVESIRAAVARYAAKAAEYTDGRSRAFASLQRMPNRAGAEALARRYLLGREWRRVEEKMGYEHEAMMKLKSRALSEFYDYMPASERDPLPCAI